jgi:hypothetical protein
MNQKQQAAKDTINKLAIELIALVNQTAPYSIANVSTIKNIALRIRYETNDLLNYEALEQVIDEEVA